jgi:folate-binding protein YgfZ
MLVLSYLSAIRFSDADAGEFLHNQLSADITGLANGQSTFACYCEPKGRVLALMLVCRINDEFYVILSAPLAQAVIDRIRIYVMRSKVTIEMLDASTVCGMMAEEAPELASPSIQAIPIPNSQKWLVLTEHDLTPARNHELETSWKTSELGDGVTWLDTETSGQFLPQMLGFEGLGAVNYRKGCYPGQEIVARTHYLGKVKRRARVLCLTSGIGPAPLEKVSIISSEQAYEAVVVDHASSEAEGTCLFVVSRMDPDLGADKLEYQDQQFPLI